MRCRAAAAGSLNPPSARNHPSSLPAWLLWSYAAGDPCNFAPSSKQARAYTRSIARRQVRLCARCVFKPLETSAG
ncbi:hypothetical protein L227DRAFT_306068 [Lentinus tigrinus ALCF2SS1-6]|uniref:Uncharacterized protein n=1 Tax=Lentinus tigrinus ALCF2SS1-6 TaxID=1328759 RepID=A0A5C2RW25_9APHY|nr:hypothetical protein L227DRAFT_306068 [Lentinus tigrinus ALCF2SS1-6]